MFTVGLESWGLGFIKAFGTNRHSRASFDSDDLVTSRSNNPELIFSRQHMSQLAKNTEPQNRNR